jgi:hypothetical protein
MAKRLENILETRFIAALPTKSLDSLQHLLHTYLSVIISIPGQQIKSY